jgi:4-hydroxy 2-oxovalerate aldolase
MNNIKVIDCTLRDGGYYNNWEFPVSLVNSYLKTMSKTGVKYVELGFRSTQNKDFKGLNWYTTDSYIKNLKIPNNINLGVMVNASEFISLQFSLRTTIKKLFKNKKESKIKFIRLACHYDELFIILDACKILKKLGYKVGVNLMQISEYKENHIFYACNLANKAKLDMLYIADSLGALNQEDISSLVSTVRKYWRGPIGIHAHDNLGRAISNTLSALNAGCNWLDSTVMGMGRGPGNTQTEYLLIHLNNFKNTNTNIKKFNILPLMEFITKDFVDLKEYYKWGMNPYYYLAGSYSIHPTYIQEMMAMKLNNSEMLNAIEYLNKIGAKKYNSELVKIEFGKKNLLNKGTWSPLNTIKSRQVILIATGPKMIDYKNEVENYIKIKKPYVIALDPSVIINKKYIDLYVSCNPLKLITDIDKIKNVKSSLAIPHSLLTKNLINKFKNIKLLNYEVAVQIGKYKIYKKEAVIPKLYNVAYALSLATSGNAKNILLAGFDGYGLNDIRTKTIDELFLSYTLSKNSKDLIATTPTIYKIKSSSIYSFL